MTECQACGCPIEFIIGPNGNSIPVRKVRTIYYMTDTGQLAKDELAEDGVHKPDRYVSHFETCSDPGRFSRGKS